MAREGKMHPFVTMLLDEYKNHDISAVKKFDEVFFTVKIEILRKGYEGKFTSIKSKDSAFISGTSKTLNELLFGTGLIEHPYSMTSMFKKEIYSEPQYHIVKCAVIEDADS